MIPGGAPGLVVPGNINLWQRPVVRNPNGSYSTVRSTSWNVPVRLKGGIRNLEVLMPETTPSGNVSARAALANFQKSGQHLGMFDNASHANSYADRLHNWFVQNKQWFVPPKRKP